MKQILKCIPLILLGTAAMASAAAGNVSVNVSSVPKIASVSPITTSRLQTITIKGKGFGTFVSYTGNSIFTRLRDLTTHPAWEAGYSPNSDAVTLIVKSWSDTKIVLGGFGPAYGKHNRALHKGDTERIEIWNWQTVAGPAVFNVIVK